MKKYMGLCCVLLHNIAFASEYQYSQQMLDLAQQTGGTLMAFTAPSGMNQDQLEKIVAISIARAVENSTTSNSCYEQKTLPELASKMAEIDKEIEKYTEELAQLKFEKSATKNTLAQENYTTYALKDYMLTSAKKLSTRTTPKSQQKLQADYHDTALTDLDDIGTNIKQRHAEQKTSSPKQKIIPQSTLQQRQSDMHHSIVDRLELYLASDKFHTHRHDA